MVVAGPARSALSSREVLVAPDAGLEADVDLAYIVQGGEEGQPRRRRVVQGVQTAGSGQPLPDVGLGQQRLETGANVGQVVFQQMDALWPRLPVGLRLCPELAGVVRRGFGGGHVYSFSVGPGISVWPSPRLRPFPPRSILEAATGCR